MVNRVAVGRPSVLADENAVRKLEEAFQWDCNVSEACAHADISRSTYYKLLAEDDRFSCRMMSAQEWPFIMAKKIMFTQMIEGRDGTLALKFLERRQKESYATRQEHMNKYDALSMEELKAQEKVLRAEIAAIENANSRDNLEPMEVH